VAGPLPSTSFLGGLAAGERQALEAISSSRQWPSGAIVIHEGDGPGAVLFILDGMVKVVKTATTGQEILIELRRGGDVVGELAALDGDRRAASVVTVTPVSALATTVDRFNHLLRTEAAITHRLLVTIVSRLRTASQRQLEMGTVDVVGRVSRRLLELALAVNPGAMGRTMVRGVSQQDLAAWAGVSRDGVVRALHELRDDGVVLTGRERIEVLDLHALSRRAEG
jgi:CRP-like cAMP-binding protein